MTTMGERLYKVLDANRRPMHGGRGRYPDVGEWTFHLKSVMLAPCLYGYHLTGLSSLSRWLGPTIWEAQPCPDHEPVEQDEKIVTCSVRLVRKTGWDESAARLFAADCAKMALMGERALGREPDDRSWHSVEVVRAVARGEATSAEMDAAWDASLNAAWDAASVPARDAAWVAVGAAAGYAAWDAARAAARAAAWAAAWAGAEAAAKERMSARLAAYLDGRDPGPIAPLYGHEDDAQDG